MTACRLLIDAPASGDWNMAVDEVLLEGTEARGPTLRFYRWSQATLSLGYFQSHRDRAGHRASLGCPVVRRSSGGGAIVHDRELTYAFVAPLGWLAARRAERLYAEFHRSLIGVLARWGVAAALCHGGDGSRAEADPFLCFERRGAGDVLVGGSKIAGSAQRRRRGILQHGSVLLARSAAAPELAGVAELAAVVDPIELAGAWGRDVARRLDLNIEGSELTEDEREWVKRVAAERYASPEWIKRR